MTILEMMVGGTKNDCLMKRVFTFLAVSAILFVSCAKETEIEKVDENPIEEITDQTIKLSAAVNEGADTKVSADLAGNFSWKSGDAIAVLTSLGNNAKFTTTDDDVTAEFTGTLATGDALGAYAVYPYSAYSDADGKVVTFSLPSEYEYVAGETNMPMLGKISAGTATFKAVGGVLKLTVYNVPADAKTLDFIATANTITGDFTISDATVSAPTIAAKSGSDDIVEFDFTGNRTDHMIFYIPLPVGDLGGFTIEFYNGLTKLASKTVSKTISIGRNNIFVAPGVNLASATVLWRESFTGYSSGTKFSNSDIQTGSGYDAAYYGSATIKYTSADGTGGSSKETRIYTTDDEYNAASTPEMYVGKTGGYFKATGIPTNGAASMTLTYYSNNAAITVTSETDGISIGAVTSSGNKRTATITNNKSASTIDLQFAVSGSNSRLDDISVTTTGSATPIPQISFTGTGAVTIAAGSLNTTVTNVSLANSIDANGITYVIDPASTWISTATITSGSIATGDATLTITAGSYNHDSDPRVGYVYLRSTGAASKTITVTQNPSLVPNPTLTTTPADASFTVTWTGDTKAKNYIGYYSTTKDMADPTSGTALNITNVGSAYTASPSGTVTNGTKYYVYVKVNDVADGYSSKYATLSTWSSGSVTPGASSTETFTYLSLYSGVTTSQAVDGKSDTVGAITIAYSTGTGSSVPTYYKTGNAMRFYNGNTLTITGGTITKVVLTFNTDGFATAFAGSDVNLSASDTQVTWEGSSTNLVINAHGTSRCASIAVTYEYE